MQSNTSKKEVQVCGSENISSFPSITQSNHVTSDMKPTTTLEHEITKPNNDIDIKIHTKESSQPPHLQNNTTANDTSSKKIPTVSFESSTNTASVPFHVNRIYDLNHVCLLSSISSLFPDITLLIENLSFYQSFMKVM